MPSEHLPPSQPSHQPDLSSQQVKVCSGCHHPLPPDVDPPALFFSDSIICPLCRDRSPQRAQQPQQPQPCDRALRLDIDHVLLDPPLPLAINFPPSPHTPTSPVHLPSPSQDHQDRATCFSPIEPIHSSEPPSPSGPDQGAPIPSATCQRPTLVIDSAPFPSSSSQPCSPSPVSSTRTPTHPNKLAPPPHVPDPFIDITRIRTRSQGHHCLYPGATFQGTQKNGRSSYDVTVTIVDVDFSSSYLCGYLCIRGLTEDWPELTTYFDAEIIGSRHGFLTRNWDATEEEDMVHWSRFPAFRHVKSKLKGPYLTTDTDCGAVFMRWKERFLVPDHRVQDINGASFAGFYYVCVDFNSHPTTPSSTRPLSTARSPVRGRVSLDAPILPPKPEPVRQPRVPPSREGDVTTRRSSSIGARAGPNVATMSGFYFHQHSEPYQQLSLKHVPDTVSTSFEVR